MVGERIRSLRQVRGLGLSELADNASVSKGYLSALETGGESNPSLDVLIRIAQALEVTLADLLNTPKVKPKLEVPAQLPAGLREFVEEQRRRNKIVSAHDIAWMYNAQFRGGKGEPTSEDYAIMYRALARPAEDDE